MAALVVSLTCGLVVAFLSWRRRRMMAGSVLVIRELRALASRPVTFRVPAPDEDWLIERLRGVELDEQDLERLGFTRLGDLVVQREGDGALRSMRALVDGAGTTCALLSMTAETRAEPMLQLESYPPDGEIVTLRAMSAGSLALPPFTRRQVLDPLLGSEQIVARHRVFMRLGEGAGALAKITTIEELVDEQQRRHELYVRWRDAQDPEALLEEDLRGVLGTRYPRQGKAWARRLATLPRATAVLKP